MASPFLPLQIRLSFHAWKVPLFCDAPLIPPARWDTIFSAWKPPQNLWLWFSTNFILQITMSTWILLKLFGEDILFLTCFLKSFCRCNWGVVESLASQSRAWTSSIHITCDLVRNAGTPEPPKTYCTRSVLYKVLTLKHWCKALRIGQGELDSAMWFWETQCLCLHESSMILLLICIQVEMGT